MSAANARAGKTFPAGINFIWVRNPGARAAGLTGWRSFGNGTRSTGCRAVSWIWSTGYWVDVFIIAVSAGCNFTIVGRC